MLELVVSGGQTGADQAGLRAAEAAGLRTGGWAALGWMTKAGPAPWLEDFGLVECPRPGYPARTEANARDSDGTLWLGAAGSQGFIATWRACRDLGRPFLASPEGDRAGAIVLDWMAAARIRALNVAGNRRSIGDAWSACHGHREGFEPRCERFLAGVFARALGRVG